MEGFASGSRGHVVEESCEEVYGRLPGQLMVLECIRTLSSRWRCSWRGAKLLFWKIYRKCMENAF